MVGITGYGAYIPRYRMGRPAILQQVGWFARGMGSGEKAVANCDEDAITMAYAAAKGCSSKDVDVFYMASLSFPYQVRQNSAIVAEALGFDENMRTADYTSSLQCGTDALSAAFDAVLGGTAKQALICASDARKAKPASAQDYSWGDGAAALRLGKDNVIATLLGSSAVTADFIDKWQIDNEHFEHSWEDRWIREEGYLKIIPNAVNHLLKKTGTAMEDYAKVCLACPNAGALKALSKRCKVAPEQLVDTLVGVIGDTGSAMPMLMLVSALETANPGDKILVVSFGSGAQAFAFETTSAIASSPDRGCLARTMERKAPLMEYARYLAYKGLVEFDASIRGELVAATAMSVLHQQGRAISYLEGVRCTKCGTPQFPKHQICVNPECNATGQMEPYPFAGRIGTIASFTADSLAFAWDPPQLNGSLDFEGGGRIFMDFTDCTQNDVQVGTKMEMTFRRKYVDNLRGYYGYFWKATPVK